MWKRLRAVYYIVCATVDQLDAIGIAYSSSVQFFNDKKLLERLDQAKLDVIDNPHKTRKLPISERYSDKRSKGNKKRVSVVTGTTQLR